MKKRLILLGISLALVLTLSACKNNASSIENTSETTERVTLSNLVTEEETTLSEIVDSTPIYDNASKGIMLPVKDVVLGDSIDDAYRTQEILAEHTDDENPSVLFTTARYYFEKTKASSNSDEGGEDTTASSSSSTEQKIYKIVSYNEVYDFVCGENIIDEIKASLGEATEVLVDAETADFINDKITPIYALSYRAGNNTLTFYFQENYLVAGELKSHD